MRGALLLLLSGLVSAQWPMDGGSTARTNSIILNVNPSNRAVHSTFSASEPINDAASQIEGFLLNSILVTTGGYVLIASDDCKIRLFTDPGALSSLKASDSGLARGRGVGSFNIWVPLSTFNVNDVDVQYHPKECGYAGMVLDTNDVVPGVDTVYFLDGRNKAVHAVVINGTTLTFSWAVKGDFTKSVFDLDVSMLIIPKKGISVTKQLWIPLQASTLGSDGIAVTVGLDLNVVMPAPKFGNFTLVPKPDKCSFPGDDGSVLIDVNGKSTVLHLSSEEGCGLIAIDVATRTHNGVISDSVDYVFTGEDGVHSQPAYDSTLGFVYFLDFADYSNTQRVCCKLADDLSQKCTTWISTCAPIPTVGAYIDGAGNSVNGNWEWLGLAIYQGSVIVSASGAVNDDLVFARYGVRSSLFVFSNDGTYFTNYTIDGDLYNSAPLIIIPLDNTLVDAIRVIISSAKGLVHSFKYGIEGEGLTSGPLSSEPDFPAIPPEDLPETTYAFLSVTTAGTLLATTSAGGVDWSNQKAFVALANGIFDPTAAPSPSISATPTPTQTTQTTTPTPFTTPSSSKFLSPTPSPTAAAAAAAAAAAPAPPISPGASAGIAISVIGVGAAGLFFAYLRVPVISALIDSAILRLTSGGAASYTQFSESSGLVNLASARASYTPDSVSERTSILFGGK